MYARAPTRPNPFVSSSSFLSYIPAASLSTSASLLYNPTVFISFFTGVACPCLAHSYATSRRVLSVARSELEFWWIEISNSRCRLPIEFRYVARRVPGIRARARTEYLRFPRLLSDLNGLSPINIHQGWLHERGSYWLLGEERERERSFL